MSCKPQFRGSLPFVALGFLGGLLSSCRGEPTSVPSEDLAPTIAEAKGGKPTGLTSDIVVSAVDPDTVTTDTILTVRVLGSGFTEGSAVSWELAGAPTEAVKTQPPALFVSSKELHATISVSRDASLARYDVVVVAMGGKKGIGVEKLEVVAKPILLPLPEWAVTSAATDVNDRGVIVGYAGGRNEVLRPVRWTPQGSLWAVEELYFGGSTGEPAFLDLTLNDEGYVVLCRQYVSGYPPCRVRSPAGNVVEIEATLVEGMNDRGTIIGYDQRTHRWMVLRRSSPESWTEPILLSSPPGFSIWGIMAINAEDDIAGGIQDSSGSVRPAVWRWEGDGWSEAILVDTESGAAWAINSRGALAGEGRWCDRAGCTTQPVFWPAAQAPRVLLPTGDGSSQSAPPVSAMNDADLVVGTSSFRLGRKGGSVQHAVVWRPGFEGPRDLGAYHPTQHSDAKGVNNAWPALVVGRTVDSSWLERATAWIVF